MKPSLESTVLKPLDPTILDSDDFPIFSLSQVEILDHDHKLTSLLDADANNPINIIGKLDHVPSVKFLLPSISCPVNIEVTEVRTFSYGQMEEGEVAIWALGKAGWFQLKPSRRYREVYKGMVEAVVLFYFLADAHRELRKKDTPPSAERLLELYAEEPSHDCADATAAEAVLKKHNQFLMTSMQKRAENINWKKTPIFRFIKSIGSTLSSTLEDTTVTTPPTQHEDEDTIHVYTAGKGKGKTHPKSGKLSLKGQSNEAQSMFEDVSMTDVGMDITLAFPTESTAARAQRKLAETHRQQRYSKRKKLDEQTESSTIIISPSEDPSTTPIEESVFGTANPSIPAQRSKQKKEVQHIRIVDEPLPSYLAEGPDGIWRCSFDGCSKVVYGVTDTGGGDDDDGPKQLINEHYRKHAFQSQAKLDLIYKEERPYLPVGNLVKRIRELAAAKGATEATTKMVESASSGYARYKVGGTVQYPEPVRQAGY